VAAAPIGEGSGDGSYGLSLDSGSGGGPLLDSGRQLSTTQTIRSSGCGGCGSLGDGNNGGLSYEQRVTCTLTLSEAVPEPPVRYGGTSSCRDLRTRRSWGACAECRCTLNAGRDTEPRSRLPEARARCRQQLSPQCPSWPLVAAGGWVGVCVRARLEWWKS